MSRPEQKVQVFSVGLPKDGVPRDKRRYRVKWRIDGQDKTRSLKTKAEAERLQARLQMAVVAGEEFDLATGLPVSWVRDDTTWWEWSRDWLDLKWPQWAGHSRRSAVESLLAITPLMARSGAPPAGDETVRWLREHGYRPGSPGRSDPPHWLLRWSVPCPTPTPPCWSGSSRRPRPSPTARRCRGRSPGGGDRPSTPCCVPRAVGACSTTTRWTGSSGSSPPATSRWTSSTVPSYGDVIQIVDHVAGLKTDGARYATLFATVGIAGMRPSEAIALAPGALELPRQGWGLAVLRGALTSPGTRFTSTGEVVEDKELKQRPPDATREVQLAPELVERLRWHMKRWPPVDGHAFTNAAGRTPTTTNYGPVWVRARTKLWPNGHRLRGTTVYDLRHAAATMMLRAGVPPAEAARRLGHSVDILMRVYAGVFDDERQRSNDLIDRAMREHVDDRAVHR